jgi:hypothetical protein
MEIMSAAAKTILRHIRIYILPAMVHCVMKKEIIALPGVLMMY